MHGEAETSSVEQIRAGVYLVKVRIQNNNAVVKPGAFFDTQRGLDLKRTAYDKQTGAENEETGIKYLRQIQKHDENKPIAGDDHRFAFATVRGE